MTLTTSSIFLKTLFEAGITHAFVNWGSDHPALLEELERQRVESDGVNQPAIITCPNEMVALSAAHGYALVTGKPAAVIVHVDVGTQVNDFNLYSHQLFMKTSGSRWCRS
jgi:thiamine pyrophosphate-dependent acetolactate synthase large subunit-like protein